MLFNSLQFLVFFVIVTIAYWQLPLRCRWVLLLLASCYFYMAFVPIYIFILGFTIVIDYVAGLLLERIHEKRKKRIFLIVSLMANIGVLSLFKYYNFFNENLDQVLGHISRDTPFPYLKILLPIGLSFHTFQAMSYTIEVYRGNQKAERHFGIYALYVMFYPQLVAGPIERPQNVLWQFHSNHRFDVDDLKNGLMQMAFGFFKKVVIADRLGAYVDVVYQNPESMNGGTLIVATCFYSFQIYCDFSGYSDIGIGAARTMGYRLMDNFRAPYLSKSISEFWGRWHISLSTWFRDYLYIPLGGNRKSQMRLYLNLMVVFLVSGLWHGASWLFVVWGGLHGIYLVTALLRDRLLRHLGVSYSQTPITHNMQIVLTFLLVTFAWIFFRAPTMADALLIVDKIFTFSLHEPIYVLTSYSELAFSALLVAALLIKEKYHVEIATLRNRTFYFRLAIVIACCYLFGVFTNNQFIYFQF
jgi:alginate O-acetyltransferase complex protein AlgI